MVNTTLRSGIRVEMMNAGDLRQRALGAGLNLLQSSGVARLAAPVTQGLGAILMFHHVRPWSGAAFAPNRGLEITPEFLDATLTALHDWGYEVVSLDQALARVRSRTRRERPFAVLTFDDGYRDTRVHALPVLQRHKAPFTLFVTTGFAERTARLWWVEMEAAFRKLDHIEVTVRGELLSLPARTDEEKSHSFKFLYWRLRAESEEVLLACAGELAARAGLDLAQLVADLCMDWGDLARFAADPLCTIGAHTLTHPMLAKHPMDVARREIGGAKRIIEAQLGRPVEHLAYPVGDATCAGVREFAMALEQGFTSAVTTRKGMIFAEHAAHLTALPRLSINGEYQTRTALDALFSGAPFFLRNFGRKLDVA